MCALPAGADQTVFRHYGVGDGLSQSQVTAQVQDLGGYMWLGTEYGLSRFDGHQFQIFTRADGLLDNRISSAVVDGRGQVWFGHPSGGLSSFDGEAWRTYPAPPGSEGANALSLVVDPWDGIWVATLGAGLQRVDQHGELVSVARDLLPTERLIDLLVQGEKLWIGSVLGVFMLPLQNTPDRGAESWGCIEEPISPNEVVVSLTEDAFGNLWFGTSNGTVYARFPDPEPHWWGPFGAETGLPEAPVYDLIATTQGAGPEIWLATLGSGVVRLTPRYESEDIDDVIIYTVEDGLSSDAVTNAYVDREGNLWFGTDGQGVSFYHGSPFTPYLQSADPDMRMIWSLAQDNEGQMWFGTAAGLIRRGSSHSGGPEKVNKPLTFAAGLPEDIVRDIHVDTAGFLWLATGDAGLVRLDPRTEEFFIVTEEDGLPSNQLLAVTGGAGDELWLGFLEAGAARYQPPSEFSGADKGQITAFELMAGEHDTNAYDVFHDSRGRTWLATTHLGLGEYLPPTIPGEAGHFEFHGESEGLAHLSLNDIDEDSQGRLWIATDDGGIYIWDGERFQNPTGQSRVGRELVYLITCTSTDQVLIGTNRGLHRYEGSPGEFMHFDREDGFAGIETNVHATCVDANGDIWFGTINGAYKYSPSANGRNSVPPKIHITGLRANLEAIDLDRELVFDHDQNQLRIDFAGICMRAPEKVTFEHQLIGLDPDWTAPTSIPQATYANLTHGSYTFLVRSINSDGLASAVPASLEFEILAPFWRTFWFQLLSFLALCASIYLGYAWKVRAMRRTNRELEEKVRDRTRDLVAHERELKMTNASLKEALIAAERAAEAKSAFLATMSHEIRTPMNGVLGMAEILLSSELDDHQRDCAQLIQVSGSTLLSIINDVLDLSKIEAGGINLEAIEFDCTELVISVLTLMSARARGKGLQLGSSVDWRIPTPLIGDPHRIRQVLTNLLGNAIKFTETGQITVHALFSRDLGDNDISVRFEVEDSGIGIAFKDQLGVFEPFRQQDSSFARRFGGTGLGLTISKRLVECMGGAIGVTSKPGQGSRFWFSTRLQGQVRSKAAVPLAGRHILLIDGNDRIRAIQAEQLQHLGARVSAYSTPAQVPATIEPSDWLLVDGEASGSELAAAIARLRQIPALNAAALAVLVPVGASAPLVGPHSLLGKPLDPQRVLATFQSGQQHPKGVSAAAGQSDHGLPWRGAQILVIDDNRINARVAEQLLKVLHCEVTCADSGESAIAAATETDFDLILMDCQMPGMDGFETTRRIRAREASGVRTAIVALTANAMEGDREQCLQAGMDDYLAKPISRDQLRSTLARWCRFPTPGTIPADSC